MYLSSYFLRTPQKLNSLLRVSSFSLSSFLPSFQGFGYFLPNGLTNRTGCVKESGLSQVRDVQREFVGQWSNITFEKVLEVFTGWWFYLEVSCFHLRVHKESDADFSSQTTVEVSQWWEMCSLRLHVSGPSRHNEKRSNQVLSSVA